MNQRIKSVTKVFDKIATNPRFRFFGNVELGKHVSVADLRQFYHQIMYTTGAQTDKRMGIPGEDLSAVIRRPSSWPGTTAIPISAIISLI